MNPMDCLEVKIAKFLRTGVVIAGLLLFVGWLSQFKLSGDPFFNFKFYDHIPLKNLVEFHSSRANWGVLISYAGLLALISLPFIRVLLTAFLFFRQKDYTFALISLIVLSGLVLSMSLGVEY